MALDDHSDNEELKDYSENEAVRSRGQDYDLVSHTQRSFVCVSFWDTTRLHRGHHRRVYLHRAGSLGIRSESTFPRRSV